MSYTMLQWRVASKDDNCCIGKVDPECGEYNGIAAGEGYCGNGFLLAGYISKADVTLMAAAPRLLEALQALFEHCAMIHKRGGEGCNQKEADAAILAARAAIAKAVDQKEVE